jgi:hypothetical protein
MTVGIRHAPVGRLLRDLVADGLIDVTAAMEGHVWVRDVSRSNSVALIAVAGDPVLVVKQGGIAVDEHEPFAAEAVAYRWLGSSPVTLALAPKLIQELPKDRMLVVEAIRGAIPLHQLIGQPERIKEAIGELGRMLGILHAAPVAESGLPARQPWVLKVSAGRLPLALTGDEVVEEMVQRLVAHRQMREALASLGTKWTARAPIHGDVKFDNVLVTVDWPGWSGGLRVWLVDWELAGLGEPVWDLAGLVDGVLTPQVLATGRPDPVEAGRLVGPALAAHRVGVGLGHSPTQPTLAHAVVARLAQTAVQLAAMRHIDADCGEQAHRVLEAALALAKEPAAWTADLMRRCT